MNFVDRLSFDPVYGWYFVVPVTLIAVASLWLTLTSTGISKTGRGVLAVLRLAALAVLFLGWIRPGMITEQTRETPGAIAVLMDRSQSMTLPSESPAKNRWQVQQETWKELESATNLQLGQTKIVPYFYDQKLMAAEAEDLPVLQKSFAADPSGRMTDLGRALSDLSRTQVDPPLRGVILMGDATQTAIPAEIAPSLIARQMAQLDQPVFFIGIGSQSEQSGLRDVAVEGLPEHYAAFVKKDLNVRFVLRSQGLQNQPINVQLKLRASGKADQILASREVLAARADQLLPQEFNITVPEQGEYLLEATAIPVDAEDQIESNNLALSFVTVREGGAKLLYVEGEPREEQLFVKRALNESLDFDLIQEWIPPRQWNQPTDLLSRYELRDFDAILIGDIPASALSTQTMRALADRVREGGGMLFSGGYFAFDAGGYGGSPLDPVFPVQLRRGRAQRLGTPIDRSLHIEGSTPLLPVRNAPPHPITMLEKTEPANTNHWRRLEPMLGMNRLGPPKTAPGIRTLLESPNGEPALVTGTYGRGRVLAFAADSTWQWVLAGEKQSMQQFWRQCILWLINRETLSEGFKLELERRRLLIDETPELLIDWFGGSEERKMPQSVNIEVTREGTKVGSLTAVPTGANSMSAKITGLSKPGLYRAALTSKTEDGIDYNTDIAFVVRDESRELARPDADWQMMNNIVSANQVAGGRLFYPDQLPQLLEVLRSRQESSQVTTVENRRLGDAAWDSWIYLVLFCSLMCVEWALRKSWQLP